MSTKPVVNPLHPTVTQPDRLAEAVASFMAAQDKGKSPDAKAWLARFPDVAEELNRFFANQDRLRQVAGPSGTGASAMDPRSVPGYEVLGEIARGGMGVVYKARHMQLGRLVALKMILTGEFAAPVERERFRSEAEAIANLDHPHIVPIYEIGEQQGRLFFTMKFMEGGTLAGRLADFRLPVCDVKTRNDAEGNIWSRLEIRERKTKLADVMSAVARAVHHAHQRGILHRDLKPGNILIDAQDRPLVTDFGLAKRMERRGTDESLTVTGAVVGTPAFMAPEQARGEKVLTTAVDVYGLGTILYMLLTGQPPFRGASLLDTLQQVREREPDRPRTHNPLVDRDLETICLKCLHKDPEKRYGSAEALAEDLDHWRHGEPIEARPVGRLGRFGRWCGRNPKVAALLAMIAVLTSLVAVVSTVGFVTARDALGRESEQRGIAEDERNTSRRAQALAEAERKKSIQAQTDAVKARDEVVRQNDQITKNLYTAYMRLTYEAVGHRQLARASEFLDLYGPQTGVHGLAGWEWCYLRSACRQAVLHTFLLSEPSAVAWHPDGLELASAGSDGTIRIWNRATGKELQSLHGHTGPIGAIAYSADGKWIISGGQDRSVRVWNAVTGALFHSAVVHSSPIVGVAFDPQREWVASVSSGGTLRVWKLDGKMRFSVQHGSRVHGFDWSSNGKWLATIGSDRVAKVWDADLGTLRTSLAYQHDVPWAVSWSPDSRRLAAIGWGGLKVWDNETRAELVGLYSGEFSGRAVHWHPDGRSLAVACDDWTVKVMDLELKLATRILGNHTHRVMAVRWASDGMHLASASLDGTVKIQDPDAQDCVSRLLGHTGDVWTVAWSPDGKKLASGGLDKSLKIWDLASGREDTTIKTVGLVRMAAWNREGKRLAVSIYGGGVQIYDSSTWNHAVSLEGVEQWQGSVGWSPDGTRVLCSGWDGEVRIHDGNTGKLLRKLAAHHGRSDDVAFSPDGRYLATCGTDGKVRIWFAETGRPALTFSGHSGEILSVRWRRDGLQLASSGADGAIVIWDIASGEEIRQLRGHTASVISLDWSPDGRRLASAGHDQTVKVWDPGTGQDLLTFRPTGQDLLNSRPSLGRILVVAWSQDGRQLAAGSGRGSVILWDASLAFQEYKAPAPSPLSDEDATKMAQMLVAALFDAHGTPQAVLAQVQQQKNLAPSVRRAAMDQTQRGIPKPAPARTTAPRTPPESESSKKIAEKTKTPG